MQEKRRREEGRRQKVKENERLQRLVQEIERRYEEEGSRKRQDKNRELKEVKRRVKGEEGGCEDEEGRGRLKSQSSTRRKESRKGQKRC